MNLTNGIAALVLAAGRSSRMGCCKPALPLGSGPAIARVVQTLLEAGVNDLMVVTGSKREEVTAALGALPVRYVHNAEHQTGMFSSVLAGVAAVPTTTHAFFVLPADYPLVTSDVVTHLVAEFRRGKAGIVHPTCCGVRGHPPLLAGRYRDGLQDCAPTDNLASFLQRHERDALEVEVDDFSILMDMDTPADYQRMRRFAALLDGRAGALLREDALYLLALVRTPDPVVRHCKRVSQVAETLAQALSPLLPSLDVELTGTAGLVHDIARARRRHALVGERMLAGLGLPRLASVVGAHMVLPQRLVDSPELTEEHLVYLADKLVAGDQVVGLEVRGARRFRELEDAGADGHVLGQARARMQLAEAIQDRVEAALGTSVDALLGRAG